MKKTHHSNKFMVKGMKEATDKVTSLRKRKNKITVIGIDRIKVIQGTHQVQFMCRPICKQGNMKDTHIARRKNPKNRRTQDL